MTPRRRLLLLIPILLLAFTLRVWGMAERSMWWDEGIGVWAARLPMLEGVRWTATDSHPPLFYMLLRLWWLVAGEGETILRYPSAIASLLTVVLTYHLGRQLASDRVGILAALLLALSRFNIMWAQEIRMYTLSATLATAALAAAVWMWRQGNGKRRWLPWLVYVCAALGGLYTLYLAITVVAVANVGFLVAWWRRRWEGRMLRYWASAQVVVALLTVPWVLYALPRMHYLATDEPFKPGFFLQLYATMLTVGSSLDLARAVPYVISIVTGLVLGTALIVQNMPARRSPASAARAGGLAALVAGLLLLPAAVVVVSLPGLDLGYSRPLAPRYLMPLSACYVLLLAWGIDGLARGPVHHPAKLGDAEEPSRTAGRPWLWRGLAAGLAGLALMAAVSGLRTYYGGRARRDDYVTIAETLRGQRHPPDAVILYVDRDWPIFAAHYAGSRVGLPYGADLSDPVVAEAALAPIWETAAAVWLVSTPESLQADPLGTVPQWLAAHAKVVQVLVEGENTLTLYARSDLDARVRETVLRGYIPPVAVHAPHGLVGASIPLRRYRTGDTLHLGLYWIPPLADGSRVSIWREDTEIMLPVPPLTADLNIARNQVNFPLTPDMAGGEYTITVHVPGFEDTDIGTFTLLPKASGEDVSIDTIPHRTETGFGASIELIGHALPVTKVSAGDAIPLTLYWRTDRPLTERYKVFTHLLGETYNATTGNFLWGQQDNEPGSGQDLTTLWAPGAVIVDTYRIPVDPQAPPGSYVIEVGMYGLVNGTRLPVDAASGSVEDDAVYLTTITVGGTE